MPPIGQTVVASTDWDALNTVYGDAEGGPVLEFRQGDLANVTSQLRRDFSGGPLPLEPKSADWAALTSQPYNMSTMLKPLKGIPVKLEVAYRYPLAGHLRLVAGSMPTAALPASEAGQEIQVAITEQMAQKFGIGPGWS